MSKQRRELQHDRILFMPPGRATEAPMTTFIDGPANGQTLTLKRSPKFLRVTEQHGKFDALDQLYDEPEAKETLYAYRLTADHGMVHLNFGGGRGGFYAIAEYKFVESQPDDTVLLHRDAWREWCHLTDWREWCRRTDAEESA